jgi:hypothetical protein
MRKTLLALVLYCSTAAADKPISDVAQDMLATAKVAGSCGIFKSQLEFQEATILNGGDAFIERFWKTEATRLGMTLLEYAEVCNTATNKYISYKDTFTIK